MSGLRKLPWAVIVVFVLMASAVSGIYDLGYYRGHADGSVQMKCAIFGVVDSMTEGTPDPSETRLTRLGCRTDKSGKVVRS